MQQYNYSCLFADLNLLVRLVKQRQDSHFMLVQHISKISQTQTQNNVFLDQQLLLHYKFRQNLRNKDQQFSESYSKMEQNLLLFRKVEGEFLKLFQKSLARVAEISQASVERISFNQGLYEYEFRCFAEVFGKYQAENNFSGAVGLVTGYLNEKYEVDLGLLDGLIGMIENGEREEMKGVIGRRYEMIRVKMEAERERVVKVKEEEVRLAKERQREESEQRSKLEEKMRLAQEMQKVLIKNRKKTSKFAETVIFKIYQPMAEFSKVQYLEDILFANEFQKREKLLAEIEERNKPVKTELVKFIAYSRNMESSIKVLENERGTEKEIRKLNSSPKFNSNARKALCAKSNCVSNKKIDANTSIETVPELPILKQKKLKVVPSCKIYQHTFQNYATNLVFQVPEKPGVYIKNFRSQKIQNKNQPRSLSPKPISVFETVRVIAEKRKGSQATEGLPQIHVPERVSFDIGKTKIGFYSRNNPKVLHFNSKGRKKSETPRKILNLVEVKAAHKLSLKVAQEHQSPEPHSLKRILKW